MPVTYNNIQLISKNGPVGSLRRLRSKLSLRIALVSHVRHPAAQAEGAVATWESSFLVERSKVQKNKRNHPCTF